MDVTCVVVTGLAIAALFGQLLSPLIYTYRVEGGALVIRFGPITAERIGLQEITNIAVGAIFWRMLPFSSPLIRCGMRMMSPWVLISVRGEAKPRFGISPFKPHEYARALCLEVEAAQRSGV